MSNEHLYTAISQRFGFSLPDEYRRLESRGLLTLTAPAHASQFTKPGTYLWLNEMEWYSLEKIAEFKFWPDQLPGFVPFAFTGGGDDWCWQPEFTDSRGTRVVCCWHDSNMATVYAPDFASALFRQVIEFCSTTDDDELDVPAFLRRWAIDLAPIFPTRWCEQLRQWANGTKLPALSFSEAAVLARQEIAYDLMDSEIPRTQATA